MPREDKSGDKWAIVAWHDSDLGGSVVVAGVKGVGVGRFGLGRCDSHEYGRVAIVSQETPAVKKRQILSQSLAVHPSILSEHNVG